MLYFILVNIYAGLMYIVYLGLLRNRTWHSFSRVYLLLNAVVPLVLPLIQLPVSAAALQKGNSVSNIVLPVVNISARANTSLHISAGMLSGWLVFYVLLSMLLLARLMRQVARIRRFIAKHPVEQQGETEVIHDAAVSPGSWRNYIFLPQADIDASILAHEEAHVCLRHSDDLFLLRLLQCLFWPDIIFQYIIKEIKVVHEFQADSYSSNGEEYIAAMLNNAFGTKTFSLSHTFFHHPLKRRIKMLQNANKSRMPYLLAIIVGITVCSTIVVAQSVKHDNSKSKAATTRSNARDTTNYKRVFNTTEVNSLPRFTGLSDINQFMEANLVYPDSAKARKIEGRVITQFVVDESGKVTDISVVSSPSPLLSAAAINAVRKMPTWIPGEKNGKSVKVSYVLPISFKLN